MAQEDKQQHGGQLWIASRLCNSKLDAFNYLEFEAIKNDSGSNAFVMTPKRWVTDIRAIGGYRHDNQRRQNTMSQLIKSDKDYAAWVESLSSRFRQMQIKAATKVNKEMLMFYWSLGKDIVEMNVEGTWGTGLLKKLSQDLKDALPGQNSFSPTNLGYMRRFYLLHPSNCPQDGGENNSNEIHPQVGEKLFCIPWGHHKYILDKCNGDIEKARFYIEKTVENNWSRSVLLNWLTTDLYERQGKAITNFNSQLPEIQGDLAQEMTKDPYSFDFLTDALQNNIVKFLLELGSGFAFVGILK